MSKENTAAAPAIDLGLSGKVAIVTGGGSRAEGIGNGRAAAVLLARAGCSVAVIDLDRSAANATVELIEAEGGRALALVANVTEASECERVVATVVERYGRLDVLDNNVGIGSRKSVVDESLANWQHVMNVNLTTMMLMGKYAIPAMIASGDGGSIINVSSISALRPRGLTAYSTSKGAVIALTKAMAVDHGVDGIRVNCVAPGPVYTPMVSSKGMTSANREGRRKASVLGLEGTGWDIGNTVLYLASSLSRYVTGQTVVVDGGATLVGPKRESASE
jgi:NAD(P)-dependent dehydrogenase (short-subunit alcohol dehydrogenase family)